MMNSDSFSNDKKTKFHRLSSVRKQEKVSWKSLSKRTGIPICELMRQEDESADIRLSTLYKWHRAFNVPIEELVMEPSDVPSPSLQLRIHLIKVTKTALLMLEQSSDEQIRILSQRLLDQLVEIMPELKHVGPWPTRNTPRDGSDLPKIVTQQIASELLGD